MKRVFICGYFNYPRGGAASNYVQYLAKIFKEIGCRVYIISNVNQEIIHTKKMIEYDEVEVIPFALRKAKIPHFIDYNFGMGKIIVDKLRLFDLNEEDIVIAYSRDSATLFSLIKYAHKKKTRIGSCVVEWFDEKYYGGMSWSKINFNTSFYILNKKMDFLFPISSYIQTYYNQAGVKTFLIPCLADTKEYEYDRKYKECKGKRRFIFPGNGMMKDAFGNMLKAIKMLTDEELDKFEFHVCGLGKFAEEIIERYDLTCLIGKNIFLHKWMKYDELIKLYQECHFLLLAREICRMTKANFPSKVPETLTYGLIPICSKVGDYTSIYLKDMDNSIIIDGCSAEKIREAIVKALSLSDDDVMKLADRCRETAENRFDYRVWTEKVKSFLLL